MREVHQCRLGNAHLAADPNMIQLSGVDEVLHIALMLTGGDHGGERGRQSL